MNRKQYNKYKRNWRYIRYLSGICYECGFSSGNYSRCMKHRIMRSQSQFRYGQRKKNDSSRSI